MSRLLHNIESIIRVFDKFSKEDGDRTALSKGELKLLIQEEFAEVIENPQHPETVETVFQVLDQDQDAKVDFEEFTVLVFKVAKACFKEAQRCRDGPAEEQSNQGRSNTQQQDGQPPKEDSPSPSTPAPDNASEDPSPEEEEDANSQLPEELPLTHSTQEENEEQEAVKQAATHEENGVEQGHAQTFQQDPQTTIEEARGQDIQEPLATESQQETIHPSSQASQTEEQVQAGQQEGNAKGSEQEQATRPEEQQTLSQNGTRESQRGEQDAADPKPQEAPEDDQEPNCKGAQESQASEEGLTGQILPDPQAASLECQEDEASEQSSTHKQEEVSQAEEMPTKLQESKPQMQAPDPEEDSKEEPVDESSQGPTRDAPESELVRQDQEAYKSFPPEEHPDDQPQDRQGQESEQTSATSQGDPSDKPKESPANRGPRNSPTRQPFKTSWSHQHLKL